MANLLKSVWKEKCPFCGEGDVFKKTGFLRVPQMNESCPVCKRDLVGEPGYFFGAMYVSYAISVFTGLAIFLFCRFVLGIDSIYVLLPVIILAILLISFKNFKWSRIVWLKIFPPGENTNFHRK
jgi:uncharacterized protein (DUF983 family)